MILRPDYIKAVEPYIDAPLVNNTGGRFSVLIKFPQIKGGWRKLTAS